jgi:hypothetical protein
MDAISNADRLVRMLRQRLEERAKAKVASRTVSAAPVDARGLDKVRAVTGELAGAGAKDEQLQRALVEQLLADQFGAAMVNEPKFQQIVDRVHAIMEEDLDVGAMLKQTLFDLREGEV